MIVLAVSNSLQIVESNDNIIVSFKGDRNQYGINWSDAPDGFSVQARVSGTLQNVRTPIEESIYRQSNGYYRRGLTIVEKTYELHTDWYPEEFHEQLVIGLKHDHFYVNNVELFSNGQYDNEYSEFDEFSQGITTLYKQNYNKTNQPCG